MRDALCASEPGIGLVIQMVVLCLVALSAWLVLRVGRISLGQQAYFGLGAYAAALLTTVSGWSLGEALLAATVCGAVCALLLSWPLLRLPGLQYAVATLAVAELVRLGLSAWRYQVPQPNGSMAGPDGVHGFRDIRWLFDHQVGQTDYMVLALLALACVVMALLLLARTRLGLAMQAVGHDELLADSQGLPVLCIRLLATTLAGAVAAFAGGLYAHQLTYLEPAIFDPMLGIHAVGYSMLGGLATPLGPLLGAAFDLGLLEATRLFEGWRMVLFGTLVAVFLRWRPRGLLDETLLQRVAALWRGARACPSLSLLQARPEASPSLCEGISMNKNHLLDQRTVIVTGGATGIGQAFAVQSAAQGANVVVADMTEADETVKLIEAAGGQAIAVRVDVSDQASVDAMAAAALKRFGRIDGLINNAAYFREVKLTPFEEIDPAIWERIFRVNVQGVWNCCKAVMPAMRAQNSGAIVNIASVVAVAGQPGYLHYVASKGAVLAMTKGLAKECGVSNVRVNVIAPGFVITDATKNRPVEWQQSFLKARAISREQRPDDLVGTAMYLMSDLSAFVSGQTIVVDGGHIMY